MDPNETWKWMLDRLACGEMRAAEACCMDLQDWLRKGGFLPDALKDSVFTGARALALLENLHLLLMWGREGRPAQLRTKEDDMAVIGEPHSADCDCSVCKPLRNRYMLTISPKDHGKANSLLLTPKWSGQHGYTGLPSRKIFHFGSEADKQTVAAAFDQMGIKYRTGDPFDGPDPW